MRTETLSILAEAIRNLVGQDTIVLGDFNLHHLLWSARYRRTGQGPSAQQLLTIIVEFQLQLLTVAGTTTHRWKDGETTIDLTFASEDLASQVIHWKIDHRLDCDSDHLPIAIAIDWSWQPSTPTRKWLWAKTNPATLRQTIRDHLASSAAIDLSNEERIDNLVSSIINALNAGIEASTPWSNPSPRSIPGFDQACKDICTEVQQLRRRWQRTRQDDDYEAYRQARNRKGRLIQKTLRKNHRQRVKDASASQSGL